jgi:hypothetical protein
MIRNLEIQSHHPLLMLLMLLMLLIRNRDAQDSCLPSQVLAAQHSRHQ